MRRSAVTIINPGADVHHPHPTDRRLSAPRLSAKIPSMRQSPPPSVRTRSAAVLFLLILSHAPSIPGTCATRRRFAWLARQPWSNGNVGMLGISWGGFNSIQMAMRRPPALKAILAIAATEALFKEDVHYMDGLMHVDEFEVAMDLDQGRSGGPGFVLDEDTLSRRMDSDPWSLDYFRHQRDGAFWREPIRRFEDIRIPCFLIGGLQDGYRDSIPRMLEHVPAPVHAWIGPWNHDYPNTSMYGPKVEWRDQAVRWFDHWLKGIDNGVERDPRLVIYEQHSHPPGNAEQDVPGEWRTESWPPAGVKPTAWYFAPNHQLATAPTAEAIDHLLYVPSAGTEAGFWWGELLPDQRGVDAYSLVYDSPPLTTPVAILGFAHARLLATADAPLADWMVRLEDVSPDGQVTAITGPPYTSSHLECPMAHGLAHPLRHDHGAATRRPRRLRSDLTHRPIERRRAAGFRGARAERSRSRDFHPRRLCLARHLGSRARHRPPKQ